MKIAPYNLMIFLLLFVSCSKSENSSPQLLSAKTTIEPNILVVTNLNNDLILKLVNQYRTSGCNCGISVMPAVAPVSWSNLLAAAASAHAKDMLTNNFFSHESSNGNSIVNRYAAVGYKWAFLAENIANGQINEEAVVAAWLASENHCKNIMSNNIKDMGVAKEGPFWVQNFGSQK